MSCKFQMVDPTEGIADTMREAMAGPDEKVARAMQDLKQKAEGRGGKADRWAVAHGGNDQVIPTARARFAGDDAGYMQADHPDAIAAQLAQASLAAPIFRARGAGRQPEEDEQPEDEEDEQDQEDEDEFDSDDEEFLNDPELDKIRMKRLGQIKQQSELRQEQLAKGHGQYREITQDDFLKEVCGSNFVICHFYHKDFERCKVIDHHLRILALQHLETRFVRIDAEKTPFFVEKLKVQVLPTVLVFEDGIAKNDERIVGFDGLMDGLEPGKEDEFKTETLEKYLADLGALLLPEGHGKEDEEHEKRGHGAIWGGCQPTAEDEDEDF